MKSICRVGTALCVSFSFVPADAYIRGLLAGAAALVFMRYLEMLKDTPPQDQTPRGKDNV